MFLLRIAYSMQMKQEYHLFLLTAKCFLQRQKAGGRLSSGKRGRNVTLVVCVNASGRFTPPFFIFRRGNFDHRLMLNAPSEAAAIAKQNG